MQFKIAFQNYTIFVARRQKKQSLETLKERFNLHILPYFSDYDIYILTKEDIINWQNEILKKNFSNNYNKSLHFLLSGFLNYCCSYHNLSVNVASQVGSFPKKYEKDKHDFYTFKEFRKFIKCVDNNIYKQFFNLMFYTGTRPGEAMALKFSDLKGNYISITKTMESHKKREIGTPKTFSSIRDIRIDYKLKKDLLKLQKYYIKEYNDSCFDYFIFGGKKPLAPTTINRHKQKACFKAHIRTITLHQYRHSHATLLLHRGVLINEISRRLGHSKVSTTLDIYTHTDLKQEKRVIRTLNSLRFDIFKQ